VKIYRAHSRRRSWAKQKLKRIMKCKKATKLEKAEAKTEIDIERSCLRDANTIYTRLTHQ